MEKKKNLTIGVVGLGLIGASLSAAFTNAGYRVLGGDKDKSTRDFAVMAGTIADTLCDANISECDLIFIAISVKQAEDWLKEKVALISPETVVIDCCGVKRSICDVGEQLSDEYGFKFIGGHPMAGKQIGGYKNSSPDLFNGATFCIVRNKNSDIKLMANVKTILEDAGFSKFVVMTPEEHDRVISFTSQMAHLISNAYIKSDVAKVNETALLSGGAFRDMTRVAYLDESMWTELFLENADNLLEELNGFIGELERYKNALEEKDGNKISNLLTEGKERKIEIEKNR